jgi:plastocyanin
MMLSRRSILQIGGGLLAGLAAPRASLAGEVVEIRMQGAPDGSHVWYDPIGVRIDPGQTIRWINLDPGNSHTATAYHPQNFEHPWRIPRNAQPWNSDYLLPDQTFSVTLTQEGVYDYFCIPHEHAGMVGRIVVGHPTGAWEDGTAAQTDGSEAIPEAARNAFPPVEEIARLGRVRRP